MKKVKGLAGAVLAAASISTAVVGLTACKSSHSHVYGDYVASGEQGHYRPAICKDHGGVRTEIEAHEYTEKDGTVCGKCGYEKSGTPEQNPEQSDDGFKVSANAKSLIISGVERNDVQLSYANKSHSVDRGAIKIYINESTEENPVFGSEVPSENFTLTLTSPTGKECADWTDLREDGEYVISAVLKNCATVLRGEVTVKVRNAILPDTLAVKQGAVLTQHKSDEDKMTGGWQYEVFRQNGDSVDVPAESVTVKGLKTDEVTEGAVAELISGEYVGTVVYSITEDPDAPDLPSDDVEFRLVGLTVEKNGDDTVAEFTSGDIFTVNEAYSFIGTFVEENCGETVRREITEELEFSLCGLPVIPDETALTAELFHDFGDCTVTVSCKGITAEYDVKLLPPPLTGVDGIAVKVSDTFERTVFDDNETVTLKPEDLTVTVLGEEAGNGDISLSETVAYCCGEDGVKTAIPANGLAICAGEYEITVEITVSRGYAAERFEAACRLVITVDATLKNVSVGGVSSLATGNIVKTTELVSSRSGSISVTANSSKKITVEKKTITYEDTTYAKRLNFTGGGSVQYGSVKFEVKDECKIALCVSAKEFTEVTFILADGNGVIEEFFVEGTDEVIKIKYSLPSGGVYYFYSAEGAFSFYDAEIIYG